MLRLGVSTAVVVVVLDQITKGAVLAFFAGMPRAVEVTPFFNLVLVWNRGVSFGMFGGGSVPPWALSTLALAVAAALVLWLWRADNRPMAFGLGLVIGGAVGNAIDRLRFGAVVDFLDFHLGRYHWPAFNVADAAITIGVGLLLLDALLGGAGGRERRTKQE
jgi:signal peptidase II